MSLSRIRIAVRLPAAFLLLVAVSLCVLGIFSYRSAKTTLLNTAEGELIDVAASEADAIRHWADEVETDLEMQARSPLLANALRSFSAAWDVLGPTARDQLTSLYVSGNSFPAFQRYDLDDAGDGSVYSRMHARFHDHFRALMRRGAYRDVYLFDASGRVVYTTAKQDDFGTSVAEGGDDIFLAAISDLLQNGEAAEARFVDFYDYGTAAEPSAFIAAPVLDESGAAGGAIAYRLTATTLSAQIGESAGLGASGQTFAIGTDGHARTEATGWRDNSLPAGSQLLGAAPGLLEGSLEGNSDLQDQLVAYAPVAIFGEKWIVIASKGLDEILATVDDFTRNTLIFGGIILAVTAAVGLWIARGVSSPLRDMTNCIRQICEENYEVAAPHGARRDEIGDISRSMEQLRERLQGTHALAREMAFKGAALETTSAALMMTDENFVITYMNEAVKAMLRRRSEDFRVVQADFDADKLVGLNIDTFHDKPDHIRKLISHPDRLPFQTDIRVGSARVQLDINAVWGPDRSITGLVVEWVDVTEERRKTSVLNAIESGQIMGEFDTAGNVTRLNQNFEATINADAKSCLGRKLADFIELDGAPVGHDLCRDVAAGQTVQGSFLIRRPDGSTAIVEGGVYPVLDRRNDTTGMTLIGTDVTEAQAQLREAETRQKAMQAAQQSVVEALRIGMRDISNGDLTSRLEKPFEPEYEQLRTDFNDALENLTGAMKNIASETGAMHHETSEIVKAADEMSVRTERQAMTLQETASSLDEVTTNITQTASGSAKANEVVTEARARAEASGSVVDEAETAMAEIAESSKEIMKVISVIDDISFQTNLLALNAGVEAARAGEAGRGFAVVATEVRALAQRCANAAAEINELITVSGQHVSRGVELVGVTGDTLKKIVSSISEISDYIAEIAQAGKEQSIGLAQVNSAVNQIDHVTQQNAAMFEETTSASHALAQRADRLAETIGHFRVGELPSARGVQERRAVPRAPTRRAEGASGRVQGNLAVAPADTDSSNWEDF